MWIKRTAASIERSLCQSDFNKVYCIFRKSFWHIFRTYLSYENFPKLGAFCCASFATLCVWDWSAKRSNSGWLFFFLPWHHKKTYLNNFLEALKQIANHNLQLRQKIKNESRIFSETFSYLSFGFLSEIILNIHATNSIRQMTIHTVHAGLPARRLGRSSSELLLKSRVDCLKFAVQVVHIRFQNLPTNIICKKSEMNRSTESCAVNN